MKSESCRSCFENQREHHSFVACSAYDKQIRYTQEIRRLLAQREPFKVIAAPDYSDANATTRRCLESGTVEARKVGNIFAKAGLYPAFAAAVKKSIIHLASIELNADTPVKSNKSRKKLLTHSSYVW